MYKKSKCVDLDSCTNLMKFEHSHLFLYFCMMVVNLAETRPSVKQSISYVIRASYPLNS